MLPSSLRRLPMAANILTRSVQANERTRKAIFSGLRDGFAALGFSGVLALIALLGVKRGALPDKHNVFEDARSEIAALERAVDDARYLGIDHQQQTLGDIDLREL